MYTSQNFVIILHIRQETRNFDVLDSISADFQNNDAHMENTKQNLNLHVPKHKFHNFIRIMKVPVD